MTILDFNATYFQIQSVDLKTDSITNFDIDSLQNVELVGWNPEGRELAVHKFLSTEVQIVDYTTHEVTVTHQLNIELSYPVIWNSNNHMLLFQPDVDNRIVIWDTLTKNEFTSISGYSGRAFDLKWHPQDSHVVIAGENGVWIWNIATNTAAIVQKEKAFAVDWSPDGRQLVTHLGSEMRIYDITELP
jgi:WD40 repeat protein